MESCIWSTTSQPTTTSLRPCMVVSLTILQLWLSFYTSRPISIKRIMGLWTLSSHWTILWKLLLNWQSIRTDVFLEPFRKEQFLGPVNLVPSNSLLFVTFDYSTVLTLLFLLLNCTNNLWYLQKFRNSSFCRLALLPLWTWNSWSIHMISAWETQL